MHFSSSSRNITLEVDYTGFWLCCEAKSIIKGGDDDVHWIAQRFPLHEHFHVAKDGPRLRYGKDGGHSLKDTNHLDESTAELIGGTIFKARVKGPDNSWTDASMCLDFFLTNAYDIGVIMCDKPSPYLGSSVALIKVDRVFNPDTKHWEVPLTGLCVGLDGKLHENRIDLSLHYQNDNGLFRKKAKGYFGDSAREVGFDSYGHFQCSLYRLISNGSGYWDTPIDYDLYSDVHNYDGILTIDDPAGFWDTRGSFLRILEEIPFLGYGVAVADYVLGDKDEASRAKAECTLSTIALVCCFTATTLLGPVGACLAAAAINTAAMLAHEGMKANLGEPSFFTKSVGAGLVGFFFSEFIVLTGTGLDELIGSYTDMLEEEFVTSAIDGYIADFGLWAGKEALTELTDEEFKFLMETVLDVVQKGGSLEEAQDEVDTRIDEWFKGNDQTIVDDIYKVAQAADYKDGKLLQKVIDNTVYLIIPYTTRNSLEMASSDAIQAGGYLLTDDLVQKLVKAVTKYIYRTREELMKRLAYLLQNMNIGIPAQIRMVRLSVTRVGYTYDNNLVNKLLPMVPPEDFVTDERGTGLDKDMASIFAEQLSGRDKELLDDVVKKIIYSCGFFDNDDSRKKLIDDFIRNEYIYYSSVDRDFQLSKMVGGYFGYDDRIRPVPKAN